MLGTDKQNLYSRLGPVIGGPEQARQLTPPPRLPPSSPSLSLSFSPPTPSPLFPPSSVSARLSTQECHKTVYLLCADGQSTVIT